ncbi:MAG TPA: alcohol dehydrogenase catalytic domain-containing protein [Solirubrobacteraceae bacterium]|nr:alcohol dehydrogenase catalytic domain-containing protein [Solirubrobacteraceae bacterium]
MIGLAKLAPGEGNVDLAERPERPPGPGEVALDVHAAGVCGTDLHIWLGEYDSVPPVTMGHEVCGTVAEVGEGVDPAWVGTRVAVETFFSTCGVCPYCRAGRLSVCEQRRSIGTHVDGGFAPRLVLPARNLHRVPDGLTDAAAALTEPLACVCNSLLDPSAVQPGDDVLVIGPGAIGLIAAQVARACGGRVTVRGAERDGARLALAGVLGFETSMAGRDEPPTADVVVECSGSGPGIADALRAARRRGRVVQMGLRGADVTIPYDLICFHELTVTAGFASNPLSWRRAMGLLEAGSVELAPLVTEVVPLTDWRRAFDASRAGEGVKFVIDPR